MKKRDSKAESKKEKVRGGNHYARAVQTEAKQHEQKEQ
jgi:hypothetical protein